MEGVGHSGIEDAKSHGFQAMAAAARRGNDGTASSPDGAYTQQAPSMKVLATMRLSSCYTKFLLSAISVPEWNRVQRTWRLGILEC